MNIRRSAPWFLVALALTLSGCASGGGGSGSATRRGGANRIIEAELEAIPQLSAFQAVQRLRPRWLHTRTGSPPQVHIDGNQQIAGVDALKSLPSGEVQEMRFLGAADATTQFGTNYISGVILVTTKR